MLVLARNTLNSIKDETDKKKSIILIGDRIRIVVLSTGPGKHRVVLGIEAPEEVKISRAELLEQARE